MRNNYLQRQNPFYQPSPLPFQAPPFDRIHESDYSPAIDEGIRLCLAEVDHIARQTDTPTFENTYVALERAGALLKRVNSVFGAMTSANTSETLQQIDAEQSPKLAAMNDAINFNSRLFSRLHYIYEKRASLKLTAEACRLIEHTYQRFILTGAKLPEAQKKRLSALNQEAAALVTQFSQRLLNATKQGAVEIADKNMLSGLTPEELSAASHAAQTRNLSHRWLLLLQNTTQQPPLQTLANRETRRVLYTAAISRAEQGDENDTRAIIIRLAQLRAEQAKLIGFTDYATWALQDQMAKTPAAAIDFMTRLVAPATRRARGEADDIQSIINDSGQGRFELSAWDWQYYAEKVRKMKYDLDDAQIRPYFSLSNVLEKGVFYAAGLLYGISLQRRTDIPVYHPDVAVYEIFDKDGASLALFYADYFQRDNKSGGAWMGNFVQQSKLFGTHPVIYNVANFAKPSPGEPALLSWDDVITLFHEFGHALHGLFATQTYASLSGTATPRDFVEFPSQFNEHWADEPRVFAHYARHYRTGEPMPQALLAKIDNAARFNKGYDMTELLAAALLDMSWHRLNATAVQNVDAFENATLAEYSINIPYIPPRYRSSYFAHVWGGGYAAGYYAYLWTQMLADDAYEGFKERGGLTAQNGQRFREAVLSKGNSEDLAKVYRDWRGKEPDIAPMLRRRGLEE